MAHTQMDPALDPTIESDPVFAAATHAPNAWGWVLAYGALLLIVALAVLVNPLIAGVGAGIMIGLVLTLYGIAAIAAGLTSMSTHSRWTEVILGVIALVAGLFSLFNPVAGALSLVWAIGVWLLVAGVLQLIAGSKTRFNRGWRIGMGVLDIVLGLVLLFSGPVTGLAFLAAIVAITLAVRGVFLVLIAMEMNKGARR